MITLDFILDERVRELIAEENRRMTHIRTGTLLERVQGRGLKLPVLQRVICCCLCRNQRST